MEKISLILLFLFTLFSFWGKDSYDEKIFREIYDYLTLKEKFFPNDEGDVKEWNLIKYLEDFALSRNLKYSKKKIESDNYVTNSYNVEIFLEGTKKTNDEIIIVIPLNSFVYQQNYYDNSLTIEVTLKLIEYFRLKKTKKNLIFLFSGANRRENDNKFLGLSSYLNSKINFGKSVVVLLDVLSSKKNIKFSGSSNRRPVPLTFIKDFFDLKNDFFYFDKKEILISKLGLLETNDCKSFLLDKNINLIEFSNREKSLYNEFIFDPDYAQEIFSFFLKMTLKLDDKKIPLEIDYNYKYYNLRNFFIFIPEYVEVLVLVIIIFLVLLLRNILPNFQRLKISLMLKILPFFLILFSLFYILSFVPYALFIPVAKIIKLSAPFLNIPILYFFSIFFIPLTIFFALYELLEKIPFPKHNYLYIYGAMIFSYFNLFIFAIADISLAYNYLWVIVMITLSNFTGKNFILKFIFYIISTIPVIALLIEISSIDNLIILRRFFSSPFILHLIFTVMIFPILLLIIRVRIITRNKFKLILLDKTTISIIAGFTTFAIMIVFVFVSIKIIPEDSIVEAKVISKKSSTVLALKSPTAMRDVTVKSLDYKLFSVIRDKKEEVIPIDKIKKDYTITRKVIDKKDLINYSFEIKSDKTIEYLKIYLVSQNDVYPIETNIYFLKENNFIFDYDEQKETVYNFLIPRNIFSNFNFNITLLSNFKYKLYIILEYPFIGEEYKIINEDGFVYKKSQFIEEFELFEKVQTF